MKQHTLDKIKHHWFLLCQSKKIKHNKLYSFKFFDTPIVVFRNEGKVHALLDRCSHRNVPLTKGKIVNNCIECPYHGWQFNNEGKCVNVPGLEKPTHAERAHVPTFYLQQQQGFIWICLKPSDKTELFEIPHYNDSHYESFIWEFEVPATLANTIENFLDPMHTHTIHPTLVRTGDHRKKVLATVTKSSHHIEVKYENEGKQNGIISKWFEKSRSVSYGRFFLPSVTQMEYRSQEGLNLMITGYILPIEEHKQKITAIFIFKKSIFPRWLKRAFITPFFKLALYQDIQILKAQQNNLAQFEHNEVFCYTQLDVVRSHVEKLLFAEKMAIEPTVYLVDLLL